MTSREVVKRTIRFEGPDRLAFRFPPEVGSDFLLVGTNPPLDYRPSSGIDEWGTVWKNMGTTDLGEVKEFPIKDWDDLKAFKAPDVRELSRWQSLTNIRKENEDKFILCYGISIYERVHFLRGLENTWMDIYDEPEKLCELLDLLVEMNLAAIEMYSRLDVDGYLFSDDWGLQDRLMISPDLWRKIWKPRYAKIFKAVHEAGMHTFLHSCGYIVDILGDLIEAGLDVIHMDQQENMGLELLGRLFGGKLTFFSPVDIQNTLARGNVDEIRAYCRKMVKYLGKKEGGFIPRSYSDPVGAGHTKEAVNAMYEEFFKISREIYGK